MIHALTSIDPGLAATLRADPLFQTRLAAHPGSLSPQDFFLHQTPWVAITGAASSGKSTMIRGLAARGFQVQHEAATAYFEEQRREGRTLQETIGELFATPEASRATFNGIQKKQFMEELDLDMSAVTFMDRGFPDMFYYARKYGADLSEVLRHSVFHQAARVYILDRLPFVKSDHRVEHQDGRSDADIDREILEMDGALERDYRALGYIPVRVPVLPPEERVEFILNDLKSAGVIP